MHLRTVSLRSFVSLLLATTIGITMLSETAAVSLPNQIPNLSAKSYVVIRNQPLSEPSNKEPDVVLSKNVSSQRSIASLSKIFAAIVVSKNSFDPKKTIVTNRDDHITGLGGSRTRLELNWTYKTIDLLYAALIASDNRAVSAIGRSVGLTPQGLTKSMNEFAILLGLDKTRFSDPVGINPLNRSTAKQVAIATYIASRIPLLSRVMSTPERYVIPVKGYININYRNTNPETHRSHPRVTFLASKTGYNSDAGYCIAATVKIDKTIYTYSILGSASKYERITDQRKVLSYLLRNTH